MSKAITYEHPLNERVRTLLRLEHLFAQARYFLAGQSPWESRMLVATLMEILDIFARGDLRTELLKELERAAANLERLLENPAVDSERLGTVLRALQSLGTPLREGPGQLGQSLREDEFLNPIRQRSNIPGGSCDFDLPLYHRWLSRPPEQRHEDEKGWLATLDVVRQPVELLLKLLRNSAEPFRCEAEEGLYQQGLESGIPYQLLRIAVPAESDCYAEISGGKHRFTVRFLRPSDNGERPQPIDYPLSFQLSTCSL